ncbi:hypothetical protein P3T36_001576 [Kitasatospora sp. MAP12-15]|uniref:hypothetical protein n=1 Tax=unclassified Kitasatospora TaxID=2633591 RepID=UPI0024739AB5|nr:hypothetical protein [Kitasatospora sp. MAP12-44]MDH6112695.1 hypothetical protein [Kitasatospora sp. MAP12-44]
MKTTKLITKVTGQTVVAASLRRSPAGLLAGGVSLSGVCGGLDLDATRVSVAGALGMTGAAGSTAGSGVEAGLSLGWVSVDVDSVRLMRNERPTKASKAVAAAAKHGAYLQVVGAGAAQKQSEQLINQAKAAFIGAEAIRIRAFRGPEPWREQT